MSIETDIIKLKRLGKSARLRKERERKKKGISKVVKGRKNGKFGLLLGQGLIIRCKMKDSIHSFTLKSRDFHLPKRADVSYQFLNREIVYTIIHFNSMLWKYPLETSFLFFFSLPHFFPPINKAFWNLFDSNDSLLQCNIFQPLVSIVKPLWLTCLFVVCLKIFIARKFSTRSCILFLYDPEILYWRNRPVKTLLKAWKFEEGEKSEVYTYQLLISVLKKRKRKQFKRKGKEGKKGRANNDLTRKSSRWYFFRKITSKLPSSLHLNHHSFKKREFLLMRQYLKWTLASESISLRVRRMIFKTSSVTWVLLFLSFYLEQ